MVVDNNKHCRIQKRKKNNKIPYGSLSLQGLSEEERDTKADDRNDHHEDAICIFSDNVFQWEDSGLKIETPENASNIRKWQYLGHPIGMPLAESLSSPFLITLGCVNQDRSTRQRRLSTKHLSALCAFVSSTTRTQFTI